MVRGGTPFTGSTLIRLLAQLADVDVPESKHAFAEGLSRWLRWTDAISLSAALDGRSATAPDRVSLESAEGEFLRVRSALAKSIAEDFAVPADDFSPLRRRYTAKQQAMETSIGALRARLRDALASASPAMSRLAAVDAVMDDVLGVQERALLSTVPSWLEKRFERLRKAGEPAWADVFRKDMQAVLLAELEVRMQPVEGLLEALRTKHHE